LKFLVPYKISFLIILSKAEGQEFGLSLCRDSCWLKSSMTIKVQIENAMKSKRLVRFSRRYENSIITGYVLAVGPKFFLLLLVSDRIWFDGFECFRIVDVSKFRPCQNVVFVEAALKKRKVRKPKKPKINVKGIEEILKSAAKLFPLLAIHQEKIDPEVCFIGRVADVKNGKIPLLEIGTDAKWEITPILYKLNNITRVSFGGDYEGALALVGGEPANVDKRRQS